MILQDTNILTERELKKLKDHQYSSSCSSLLDPLMQKYWNWFVTLVPLWVAPNLITIVGLAINISTSLVLVWYCPTATERAPWWTTLSCALGLFIYQTLDAIDGKQARRTKTSSPLGELFDHGCDSLSTVFVSVASACAVRLGLYPGWMLFQCLCASTLFYCAHWQTYVSGTLTFGTIDVTEGQIVVMLVMLTSSVESFFNLDIWTSSVFLDLSPVNLYMTVGMLIGGFHLARTIPACLSGAGSGKNGSTVAGTSVLSPASPLFLLVVPACVIAYKSDQNIYHSHPIMYVLLFGLIAAKITNRLVVAHMCKGEISHRDAAMVAPLLLIINQYFNTFLPETFLLYISMIWVTVDLIWYCSKVCLEICNYLDVSLFTIPYTPTQPTGNGANSQNGNPAQSGGPVTRGRKKHSRN
eukprot:GFUD01010986.1.p1 GENE.GFUD01010986.1~~GFUD01010986.1.p1  ORF type:complete len:412 (+),score=82.52 GFUD01010986.1:65-1300(+)